MLAGPAPEVLIGPIAAATRAHPRRQRRRDAAALQPAEGGRGVQPARRAVPGADRPRAGPRGRHRPDDDLRAPARPPPGRARRLPRAARRAARLPRRRAARRPPVRAARALAARPARDARAVAARLLAAERRSGRRSSASPTRSPTSSTRRARRSRRTTSAPSTPACATPRRAWRSPPGRSWPTRRRRPGASPPRAAWRWRCCAAAGSSRCRRSSRRCGSWRARARRSGQSRRITAGTPDQVRAGLETIAHQYGADELIVVTITFDHAARRRSYELLAEAFGLGLREAA